MRTLLIPLGIVCLGILASLPFRKDTNSDLPGSWDSPAGLGGFSAQVAPGQSPRVVDPLREQSGNGLGQSESPAWVGSFLESLAKREQAKPIDNPYDIAVRELPQSYEDVAVPLMISEGSPNLLAPSTSASTQPDRFGILRDAMVANNDSAASQFPHAPWSEQGAIPVLHNPVSGGIASVMETNSEMLGNNTNSAPQLEAVPSNRETAAVNPSEVAISPVQGAPSPFHTASQSGSSQGGIDASTLSSDVVAENSMQPSEAPAAGPTVAPRQRHFIRVPKP